MSRRALRSDLMRFKAYIEMRDDATGAWRGRIEEGEVVDEDGAGPEAEAEAGEAYEDVDEQDEQDEDDEEAEEPEPEPAAEEEDEYADEAEDEAEEEPAKAKPVRRRRPAKASSRTR
jgi:hypothetical protein